MTDTVIYRIAEAIWTDRASRILAEDIAAKREEGSPGKLKFEELGEGFKRGLLSEAKAAVKEFRNLTISDYAEFSKAMHARPIGTPAERIASLEVGLRAMIDKTLES